MVEFVVSRKPPPKPKQKDNALRVPLRSRSGWQPRLGRRRYPIFGRGVSIFVGGVFNLRLKSFSNPQKERKGRTESIHHYFEGILLFYLFGIRKKIWVCLRMGASPIKSPNMAFFIRDSRTIYQLYLPSFYGM